MEGVVLYAGKPIIALAKAEAVTISLVDRERYIPMLRAAVRAAQQLAAVVSGDVSNIMLTAAVASTDRAAPAVAGTDRAADSSDQLVLDVISEKGFLAAKSIARAMYRSDPNVLGRYVQLTTVVPYEQFTISADARDLVRIRTGNAPGAFRLSAPFRAGGEILCRPPADAIGELLTRLCDPSLAGDYPQMLKLLWTLHSVMWKRSGAVAAATSAAATGALKPVPAPISAFVTVLQSRYSDRVAADSRAVSYYTGDVDNKHPPDSPLFDVYTLYALDREAGEFAVLAREHNIEIRSAISAGSGGSGGVLTVHALHSAGGRTFLARFRLWRGLIPVNASEGGSVASPFLVLNSLLGSAAKPSESYWKMFGAVVGLDPQIMFPLTMRGDYHDPVREQKRVAAANRGMPPWFPLAEAQADSKSAAPKSGGAVDDAAAGYALPTAEAYVPPTEAAAVADAADAAGSAEAAAGTAAGEDYYYD